MQTIYIVPTRGRPRNAARLMEAWRDTGARARIVFFVDVDDPARDEYEDIFLADQSARFGFMLDERRGLNGTLNHWAPKLAEHYDLIGFMGDDHLPLTNHWDERLSVLAHGGIAYGNDGVHGQDLPTAVLMDSRIIRAAGFMSPPTLRHLFMDNYWRDLGQSLGVLRYASEVMIKHLHPIAGLAAWDEGYARVNAGEIHAHDAAAYDTFRNDGSFMETHRAVRRALNLPSSWEM